MVLLDATTLILLIEPKANPPNDPATGKPLDKCKDRLEHLLLTLSEAGTRALLPTPVLAELLVRAGAARDQYFTEITTTYAFRVASFDEKAAVELSFLLDADLKAKKKLTEEETWAKLKFDRQIIAIAKVNSVTMIYTDDANLAAVAKANGLAVTHTWELPLPPVKAQHELALPEPQETDEDESEE